MNWRYIRGLPWVDSRAAFVARTPQGGRLLDLGTSDGSTLRHFAELRPDIRYAAVDLESPASLPAGAEFKRVDLEKGPLPWPADTFDTITCMHLIEHLRDSSVLWSECARVLKPGGSIYVETPGPLSLTARSVTGPAAGSVTMNFYDDPTHTSLVPLATMREDAERTGLTVRASGKARNLLFALAYPILAVFRPNTRSRYVAKLHWMGWSHFLVGAKPDE